MSPNLQNEFGRKTAAHILCRRKALQRMAPKAFVMATGQGKAGFNGIAPVEAARFKAIVEAPSRTRHGHPPLTPGAGVVECRPAWTRPLLPNQAFANSISTRGLSLSGKEPPFRKATTNVCNPRNSLYSQ